MAAAIVLLSTSILLIPNATRGQTNKPQQQQPETITPNSNDQWSFEPDRVASNSSKNELVYNYLDDQFSHNRTEVSAKNQTSDQIETAASINSVITQTTSRDEQNSNINNNYEQQQALASSNKPKRNISQKSSKSSALSQKNQLVKDQNKQQHESTLNQAAPIMKQLIKKQHQPNGSNQQKSHISVLSDNNSKKQTKIRLFNRNVVPTFSLIALLPKSKRLESNNTNKNNSQSTNQTPKSINITVKQQQQVPSKAHHNNHTISKLHFEPFGLFGANNQAHYQLSSPVRASSQMYPLAGSPHQQTSFFNQRPYDQLMAPSMDSYQRIRFKEGVPTGPNEAVPLFYASTIPESVYNHNVASLSFRHRLPLAHYPHYSNLSNLDSAWALSSQLHNEPSTISMENIQQLLSNVQANKQQPSQESLGANVTSQQQQLAAALLGERAKQLLSQIDLSSLSRPNIQNNVHVEQAKQQTNSSPAANGGALTTSPTQPQQTLMNGLIKSSARDWPASASSISDVTSGRGLTAETTPTIILEHDGPTLTTVDFGPLPQQFQTRSPPEQIAPEEEDDATFYTEEQVETESEGSQNAAKRLRQHPNQIKFQRNFMEDEHFANLRQRGQFESGHAHSRQPHSSSADGVDFYELPEHLAASQPSEFNGHHSSRPEEVEPDYLTDNNDEPNNNKNNYLRGNKSGSRRRNRSQYLDSINAIKESANYRASNNQTGGYTDRDYRDAPDYESREGRESRERDRKLQFFESDNDRNSNTDFDDRDSSTRPKDADTQIERLIRELHELRRRRKLDAGASGRGEETGGRRQPSKYESALLEELEDLLDSNSANNNADGSFDHHQIRSLRKKLLSKLRSKAQKDAHSSVLVRKNNASNRFNHNDQQQQQENLVSNNNNNYQVSSSQQDDQLTSDLSQPAVKIPLHALLLAALDRRMSPAESSSEPTSLVNNNQDAGNRQTGARQFHDLTNDLGQLLGAGSIFDHRLGNVTTSGNKQNNRHFVTTSQPAIDSATTASSTTTTSTTRSPKQTNNNDNYQQQQKLASNGTGWRYRPLVQLNISQQLKDNNQHQPQATSSPALIMDRPSIGFVGPTRPVWIYNRQHQQQRDPPGSLAASRRNFMEDFAPGPAGDFDVNRQVQEFTQDQHDPYLEPNWMRTKSAYSQPLSVSSAPPVQFDDDADYANDAHSKIKPLVPGQHHGSRSRSRRDKPRASASSEPNEAEFFDKLDRDLTKRGDDVGLMHNSNSPNDNLIDNELLDENRKDKDLRKHRNRHTSRVMKKQKSPKNNIDEQTTFDDDDDDDVRASLEHKDEKIAAESGEDKDFAAEPELKSGDSEFDDDNYYHKSTTTRRGNKNVSKKKDDNSTWKPKMIDDEVRKLESLANQKTNQQQRVKSSNQANDLNTENPSEAIDYPDESGESESQTQSKTTQPPKYISSKSNQIQTHDQNRETLKKQQHLDRTHDLTLMFKDSPITMLNAST